MRLIECDWCGDVQTLDKGDVFSVHVSWSECSGGYSGTNGICGGDLCKPCREWLKGRMGSVWAEGMGERGDASE